VVAASPETKLEGLEAKEEKENENDESKEESVALLMEQDIECPRCHGSMVLCSDFDSLYYSCEECDFTLYTIKR
jgi:ribosomal protein S27AE